MSVSWPIGQQLEFQCKACLWGRDHLSAAAVFVSSLTIDKESVAVIWYWIVFRVNFLLLVSHIFFKVLSQCMGTLDPCHSQGGCWGPRSSASFPRTALLCCAYHFRRSSYCPRVPCVPSSDAWERTWSNSQEELRGQSSLFCSGLDPPPQWDLKFGGPQNY